jgi:hypothetical protein
MAVAINGGDVDISPQYISQEILEQGFDVANVNYTVREIDLINKMPKTVQKTTNLLKCKLLPVHSPLIERIFNDVKMTAEISVCDGYDPDRVFEDMYPLYKKLDPTLPKGVYHNLPVIKLRYVIKLFKNGKPLFKKRAEIEQKHIPILEKVEKFIDDELLQCHWPNAVDKCRFHSYIHLFDSLIYAEYVPIIGQIEDRPYDLYNMMPLRELIYSLEVDPSFHKWYKPKEIIAEKKKTPQIIYFDNVDTSALTTHKKIVTCNISIGPTITLILTNAKETSFYRAVFRFNRDYATNPKKYGITALQYTVIKCEKIETEKLTPVYKTVITNIHEQLKDKMFKKISSHVLYIRQQYDLKRGGFGHGDNETIDPSSIVEYRRKYLCGMGVRSTLKSITDSGLIKDRLVTPESANIIKFNLWFYRIADEERIKSVKEIDVVNGLECEVANTIYAYTDDEIKDLISITNQFIADCEKISSQQHLENFHVINAPTNNSCHFKFNSSKNLYYDAHNMAMRVSWERFRVQFWEKDEDILEHYPGYFRNWKTSYFSQKDLVY